MNNQNVSNFDQYGNPIMPTEKKTKKHIVSFVTGLLAFLFSAAGCCIPFLGAIPTLVLGIVAIVMAVKSKKAVGKMKALAVIGMILGIVGLVVSVITSLVGLLAGGAIIAPILASLGLAGLPFLSLFLAY